jgi:hypothetical protein
MAARIKAIETHYAGVTFRSRLEARWAVFMDAVMINWEYEPERVQLPGGGTYLPDFKTAAGAYIEVKGAEENLDKPYLIRAASVLGHLSILGPVPSCRAGIPGRTVLTSAGGGDIDSVRMWLSWHDYRPVSESQRLTILDIEGMSAAGWLSVRPATGTTIGPGVEGQCKGKCPYDTARGARFEHGQSGAVR